MNFSGRRPATSLRLALAQPEAEADSQQRPDDDCVREGLLDVDLHPPEKVERGEAGRDVDQLVQAHPALVAELADRISRGGERERHHQNQSRESYRDERTVDDVQPDRIPVEELI